jgi:hypothetical protein
LLFISELSKEIQLNELNLIGIANTLIIVPKLNMYVYILYKHSRKSLGGKEKTSKLCRVSVENTRQRSYFVECQQKTLEKEVTLLSVL